MRCTVRLPRSATTHTRLTVTVGASKGPVHKAAPDYTYTYFYDDYFFSYNLCLLKRDKLIEQKKFSR